MGVERLVIKRIAQPGPEVAALMQLASRELLDRRLYSQQEVDAMSRGDFVASWVPQDSRRGTYLADVDGRVIGRVDLIARADGAGVLESLYVEKQFRQKGIGRKLIRAAVREMPGHGLFAAEVYTMEREPDAVRYWREFLAPMPPNIRGYVMLLGNRLEAIGWRIAPPEAFPV